MSLLITTLAAWHNWLVGDLIYAWQSIVIVIVIVIAGLPCQLSGTGDNSRGAIVCLYKCFVWKHFQWTYSNCECGDFSQEVSYALTAGCFLRTRENYVVSHLYRNVSRGTEIWCISKMRGVKYSFVDLLGYKRQRGKVLFLTWQPLFSFRHVTNLLTSPLHHTKQPFHSRSWTMTQTPLPTKYIYTGKHYFSHAFEITHGSSHAGWFKAWWACGILLTCVHTRCMTHCLWCQFTTSNRPMWLRISALCTLLADSLIPYVVINVKLICLWSHS